MPILRQDEMNFGAEVQSALDAFAIQERDAESAVGDLNAGIDCGAVVRGPIGFRSGLTDGWGVGAGEKSIAGSRVVAAGTEGCEAGTVAHCVSGRRGKETMDL